MTWFESVLPKVIRAKARSDANLSGAKLQWTPYSERMHIKIVYAVNGILFFLLVMVYIHPRTNAEQVIFLVMLVWSVLGAAAIPLIQTWYDDMVWRSRTIKFGPLNPIPWRPNVIDYYTKVRGKEAQKVVTATGETRRETKPKETTYAICVSGEVEQWFAGEGPAPVFGVCPVIPDADTDLGETFKKAGKFKIERQKVTFRYGFGRTNGFQYEVPGEPKIYLLGKDGWTRYVSSPLVNRVLVGLDREIRAKIYHARPNVKPWSIVVMFPEEPNGRPKDAATPVDLNVELDNMDLRAQLDIAL